MPTILKNSITILSDAGLGMAMFSLGTSCTSPIKTKLKHAKLVIVLLPRTVHGHAAEAHRLWNFCRNFQHGDSLPLRSRGHGRRVGRRRASRHAPAHSHCSGTVPATGPDLGHACTYFLGRGIQLHDASLIYW
jgi:hypothetical protein